MKGGKMKDNYVKTVNLVLLGLLMLIPGLMKLFIFKPSGVSGMLAGLGFPAALFFAWILILGEIFSGAAILTRWKLKYVTWIPVVILVIAGLTTSINWLSFGESQWPSLLLHLAVASNYWLLGATYSKK